MSVQQVAPTPVPAPVHVGAFGIHQQPEVLPLTSGAAVVEPEVVPLTSEAVVAEDNDAVFDSLIQFPKVNLIA